ANEHMVRALQTISVQRGFDPQNFSLICFGGAGGLHVCALADALKMRRAIVPIYGGVLSALGMLVAEPSRELSHSCIQDLLSSDEKKLENLFLELEAHGIKAMQQEINTRPLVKRSLDLRYKGQSFTLNIAWDGALKNIEQMFHKRHEKTYGHKLEMPVELVNLRVSLKGEKPPFALPVLNNKNKGSAEIKNIKAYGFDDLLEVHQRENLLSGQTITGPALIVEKVSTTFVDAGWRARVDGWGNLLLLLR
ncbi:N-methylhydantoinase A, partial [hydrothermal vent metagenome]